MFFKSFLMYFMVFLMMSLEYSSLVEVWFMFSSILKNLFSIYSELMLVFYLLFLLVFYSSLMGLFPYSIKIFGMLEFMFFFSFISWMVAFIFFISHTNYMLFLTKKGDSFFMTLMLLGVEFVSDFVRSISLTVRMVANVNIGVMLVYKMGYLFFMNENMILSMVMGTFLICYEMFVVGIQSYIFSFLVYTYYND